MSISRWYGTCCDTCGTETDVMPTATDSRELAVRSGWAVGIRDPDRLSHRLRDFCPEHKPAKKEPEVHTRGLQDLVASATWSDQAESVDCPVRFSHSPIRLRAGCYVQVGDDRRNAWIVWRHEETGDLSLGDGSVITGWYWSWATLTDTVFVAGQHVPILDRDSSGRVTNVHVNQFMPRGDVSPWDFAWSTPLVKTMREVLDLLLGHFSEHPETADSGSAR